MGHILVPSERVDLAAECKVLDDYALNISNHRPVYCRIMFPHVEHFERSGEVQNHTK